MASKVQFNGKPLIPSKYLEAADLNGKRHTVVIERIVRGVEFHNRSGGKDKKPVFYLRGHEKGWALNTTNLNRIAEVHGSAADKWIGKPVVLTTEMVDSFGSQVPAVRVDVRATREVFERGPSNRANGNGKNARPAPDVSRQRQDAPREGDSSSDEPFDGGPPAMTDEAQDGITEDDVPY